MSSASYLRQSEDPAAKGVDDLRLWLRSLITRPDFFTNPPLAVDDMRQAFGFAILEITQHLDEELENLMPIAAGENCNVHLEVSDFFDGRTVDWADLYDVADQLDRPALELLLVAAKDEIEWESNEIQRLDLHLHNAAIMLSQQLRLSFSYIPTPRKGLSPALLGIQLPQAPKTKQEVRHGEDEEILDFETDDFEARGRRSDTPARKIKVMSSRRTSRWRMAKSRRTRTDTTAFRL